MSTVLQKQLFQRLAAADFTMLLVCLLRYSKAFPTDIFATECGRSFQNLLHYSIYLSTCSSKNLKTWR